MRIPKLASDVSEVAKNVGIYNAAVESGRLRTIIAYVRHWYAIKEVDGTWSFGPSKFIGYSGITSEIYQKKHEQLDGRVAESALKDWFVELPIGGALETALRQELRRFIARHGKSLNQLARIHVLKSDAPPMAANQKVTSGETWRITSSPEILAGKPCIRGIRIRVADILEMLAHGASREEILADYPYLEDADITASLRICHERR